VLDYTELADKIQGIVQGRDNELENLVKKNRTNSANELAIAIFSVVDTSDNKHANGSNLRTKLGVTKEIATKVSESNIISNNDTEKF